MQRSLRFFAASLSLTLAAPGAASAICRVVEPAVDSGRDPVAFDPTTDAFFVQAPRVLVEWRCPEPGDAGVPAGDASLPDGGAAAETCADGSPAEPVHGPVVSLVVQPRVHARGGEAGLVMPVPARPDVALAREAVFSVLREVSDQSAPREVHETVTVTEDDSLGFQCTDPHYTSDATDALLAAPLALYGCGESTSDYYRPGTASRDAAVVTYGDAGTVVYEEIPTSDDYDAVVLNASSLAALTAWLDEHGFAHSAVDDAAFEAYVGEGSWFVALHVHPADLGGDEVALAPLVVTWQGDTVPITHRLQYDPAGGTLITDAWVLAPTRVDASDESALTLSAAPVSVDGFLAGFGLEEGWLTHLTIARQQREDIPDAQLVSAHVDAPPMLGSEAPIERSVAIRIASACCQGGSVAPYGRGRTFVYERTYVEGPEGAPPIPEAWFRTPEHDRSLSYCQSSYDGLGSCASTSTTSSGRTLRGCTVSRPSASTRTTSALLSWAPIALAIAMVWARGRRR